MVSGQRTNTFLWQEKKFEKVGRLMHHIRLYQFYSHSSLHVVHLSSNSPQRWYTNRMTNSFSILLRFWRIEQLWRITQIRTDSDKEWRRKKLSRARGRGPIKDPIAYLNVLIWNFSTDIWIYFNPREWAVFTIIFSLWTRVCIWWVLLTVGYGKYLYLTCHRCQNINFFYF